MVETDQPRQQALEAAMRTMDRAGVVQILNLKAQLLLLGGETGVRLIYHGFEFDKTNDLAVYAIELRLSDGSGVRVVTMPNDMLAVAPIGPREIVSSKMPAVRQDDPAFNTFLVRRGETRETAGVTGMVEYALELMQERRRETRP